MRNNVEDVDCINDSECIDVKCKPPRIPRCTDSHRCNCLLPFVPKVPWSTRLKTVHKYHIGKNDFLH
ncbi:unnamed protein product [Trifolium pratense]|uniref:Uncharacterized protein n=1 Tax=Trifolium pratense TaxID=57577 RepID=A0ACB0LGA7_TRIPR|nr:unnamed protein product [Trifolium pratense]